MKEIRLFNHLHKIFVFMHVSRVVELGKCNLIWAKKFSCENSFYIRIKIHQIAFVLAVNFTTDQTIQAVKS